MIISHFKPFFVLASSWNKEIIFLPSVYIWYLVMTFCYFPCNLPQVLPISSLEVSPISQQDIWSSAKGAIRFSITSIIKTPFCLILSKAASSIDRDRVLVVPYFLHNNYGGHCALGNLQCSRRTLWMLPRMWASTHSCLWALQAATSSSLCGLRSNMHC